MNFKSLKGTAAKLLTVGLLAGAVVLAAPAKANAQEVVVFAGPHYGYHYDRFRAEEFRRHDWRFDHRFDHRYDRRFYR